MVGDRIRQARLLAGLTLDELVERIDEVVSKQALSKYENNRCIPKPQILVKIAKALKQKAAFFLYEESPNISWFAYRKRSTMSKKTQTQIEAFATIRLEDYTKFNAMLYPEEKPQFPKSKPIKHMREAEKLAADLREAWNLGDSPIRSMTQLVEDKGAVVFSWDGDDKFDGLSGMVDDCFPVILTNGTMPDDRCRFNICHEIGHILIDDTKSDQFEKLAHRFAAAFLMPERAVRREIGDKRRNLSFSELAILKRKYGASMQAWLRRALDLEIITNNTFVEMNRAFRIRGWHKNEPSQFNGSESPSRFRQMVCRALAEGIITREKAINICPEVVEIFGDLHEEDEEMSKVELLMKLPLAERRKILDGVDGNALDDYNKDRTSKDFEVMDWEDDIESG